MRSTILSAAMLIGLGYLLGRRSARRNASRRVAFRRFEDGGPADQAQPVRDAGVSTMRDPDQRWTSRDDDLDQTFPASDATAKY